MNACASDAARQMLCGLAPSHAVAITRVLDNHKPSWLALAFRTIERDLIRKATLSPLRMSHSAFSCTVILVWGSSLNLGPVLQALATGENELLETVPLPKCRLLSLMVYNY